MNNVGAADIHHATTRPKSNADAPVGQLHHHGNGGDGDSCPGPVSFGIGVTFFDVPSGRHCSISSITINPGFPDVHIQLFRLTPDGAGQVFSGTQVGTHNVDRNDFYDGVAVSRKRRLTDRQKANLRDLASLSTITGVTLGTLGTVCVLYAPSLPGRLVCLAIGFSGTAALLLTARDLNKLAGDPPDPNFTVVAQPIILTLPRLTTDKGVTQAEADAFNALLTNEEQVIGYAKALLRSIERAQGAIDAGNIFWEKQQLDAVAVYQGKLATLLDEQPALLTNFVNALQAAGFSSLTVTPNDVSNFQQDITQNGLPASLVEKLTQLGADSATIDEIRQAIVEQNPNEVAGNFLDKLVDPELISSLQQTALALNQGLPTIAADLSITKSAAPPVGVLTSSSVTYTLSIANSGPDTGINVVVGDSLPPGTTFVSCSATGGGVCGGSGNNRTATFPSLAANASETVTLTATLNCEVANGTIVGNTAVVGSLTSDPNPDNNTASVTVTASNPSPIITNVAANPLELWPPNHQMLDVTVNYNVSDNCGTPSCTLSVSSNEPINGTGDGDTAPDWQIVNARRVRLRAERSGKGTGRVYTITITCRDSAGGISSKILTVKVPKSQKK